MSGPRKICVVTGSRADYGHLQPVMRTIANDPALTLQIVACGQHLDPRFGETWHAIEDDGFTIDDRVDFAFGDDTAVSIAEATGRGLTGFAKAFSRLNPDLVLLLGDRYEIFAAGVAAMLLTLPIAHLHGGEITEAAMDDAMRHALSKMAALHFVAAEPYKTRLVQMGEDPARVFVTGAPGLDHLTSLTMESRPELAAALKIDLSSLLFLVTYHPVTLSADRGLGAMKSLIEALGWERDAAVVFTGVNSDPGYAALQEAVGRFTAADPKRRVAVMSLGQRRYLSTLRAADAVIGNSSSGLIEAPALGVPTVNIGDRQKGRLRSHSVIDCGEETSAIAAAIARATSAEFRKSFAGKAPAYGVGGAAAKIVAILKSQPLAELRIKRFHDILSSS